MIRKAINVLIINTIAIIYFSVIAFGTLFSGVMYWVDRQPVFKAHFQLWVCALIVFGCQGLCSNLEFTGQLSFSTTALVFLTFLHIFGLCFELPLPMKTYIQCVIAGQVGSCALFLFHVPFAISSTPYVLSLVAVCIHTMHLGIKMIPNSAMRNGYLVLIAISALHMADYPFLRPYPTTAIAGLSIALAMDFCYASFIPLAIVKTQGERSTLLLEKMVLGRTRELQNANHVLSEAQEKLNAKNEELQNLSDHHRALTSVLVHDLANPIFVAQNSLPRLEALLQSETDHKVFKRINRSLETLADTTERVRAEHALRSGKKTNPEPSKVKLAEVIDCMVRDFEAHLNAKGLKLKIENGADLELLVEAEAETLKNQVLSNLLSNAIKFSHRGGVISISVQSREGKVFVRFQDNGIGVPLTMREEIFRNDRPTTSIGTDGEAGTGFGLPIVRHFVRKMGGDVRVSDSQHQIGACFEVTLKRSA